MNGLFISDLLLGIDAFHVLRPLWLLLALPVVVLWWINRRKMPKTDQQSHQLAAHLRQAMTVGKQKNSRVQPIDGVALALILAILGASGPTWTRQIDPFLATTGPLVIVLKVTPSMSETDIAPDRLSRAKFKIRDLLDMRAGGRTALVAYAGTAHPVLPFTEDPQVMLPYLEGLVPEIMPQEGANASDAFAIATDLLSAENSGGGILFVLDTLDVTDVDALDQATGQTLSVLAMLPDAQQDRGIDMLSNVSVVRVQADNADVTQLDRILNTDYRRALLQNQDQPWEDRGWWLAWPAAFLTLIWFRQGWTMRWAVIVLALGFAPANTARAEGVADWFLTPDQQGWLAYGKNDFAGAADLFADPQWKGHALYRSGQYDAAVEILDRLETPDAAFTQGLAHIKNRQYRDGVRAFETVLERDADFPGAAENLQTAKEIVGYIEETREASDTGEEAGIGADDEVFDNEANRGAETDIESQPTGGEGILTTEQWMNTVDTRTSDFLRLRFRIEATKAPE